MLVNINFWLNWSLQSEVQFTGGMTREDYRLDSDDRYRDLSRMGDALSATLRLLILILSLVLYFGQLRQFFLLPLQYLHGKPIKRKNN